MNGVVVEGQATLREASAADAVIVGSGIKTLEIVADSALMSQLQLDPSRQLIGRSVRGLSCWRSSGRSKASQPARGSISKPWVEESGVSVLNQPFVARGNVATAGGCLASQYLAAWMIARLVGIEAAYAALHYVAPVGEKDEYIARAMRNVEPFLAADSAATT